MTIQEITAAAKAEGLSYGEYVQKHGPQVTVTPPADLSAAKTRQPQEPEAAPPQDDALARACAYCGSSFQLESRVSRRKYCSPVCAQNATYARSKKRKLQQAKAADHPEKAPGEDPPGTAGGVTLGQLLKLVDFSQTPIPHLEVAGGDNAVLRGPAKSCLWEAFRARKAAKIAMGDGVLRVWLEKGEDGL